MNSVLPMLYIIGNIGTWIYLMIEDWPDVHGVFSFLLMVGLNEVLASVWPVYWAILRWIF